MLSVHSSLSLFFIYATWCGETDEKKCKSNMASFLIVHVRCCRALRCCGFSGRWALTEAETVGGRELCLPLLPQKEMTAWGGYFTANLCVYGHCGLMWAGQRSCNCARGSSAQNQIHKHTQCTECECTSHALSACTHMHAHTHSRLSNHDSGFMWVTITQGEMLRLLKCVCE